MGKTNMIIHCFSKGVSLALCVIAASITPVEGQATFRVISYMNRLSQPVGLTEGSPGVFYSVAGGGPSAAFSITVQGAKTILATFPSGYIVDALLTSAANNRFYSSVQPSISSANVFSVSSVPGKQFYPPQTPVPFPTQNLPGGKLLGVAASATLWYLVNVDLKGNVTLVYQFPSGERLPITAMYASDGNYYGVSALQDGSGYVYCVTPAGSLTKLLTFPSNSVGGVSFVPLLQAADGNLYGATSTGGANGTGTIYKLTLGGQYTLLYTFPKDWNSYPTALIEGSDGNLYGATLGQIPSGGYSQLFRVTTSGQYTLLFAMKNITADGACQCIILQGSDGVIYGTAISGGPSNGGEVFALDAGLPKPAPRAQHFHPQSGPVGTQVRIWGYNLLSASVQFNGVPATTVSNSGSNYVFATVPAGATTGPITITTPGGSATTHASFTVQ